MKPASMFLLILSTLLINACSNRQNNENSYFSTSEIGEWIQNNDFGKLKEFNKKYSKAQIEFYIDYNRYHGDHSYFRDEAKADSIKKTFQTTWDGSFKFAVNTIFFLNKLKMLDALSESIYRTPDYIYEILSKTDGTMLTSIASELPISVLKIELMRFQYPESKYKILLSEAMKRYGLNVDEGEFLVVYFSKLKASKEGLTEDFPYLYEKYPNILSNYKSTYLLFKDYNKYYPLYKQALEEGGKYNETYDQLIEEKRRLTDYMEYKRYGLTSSESKLASSKLNEINSLRSELSQHKKR